MGRARKNQAYVVFQGRKPGVYFSWEECSKQVNGFSGQKQKGYGTRWEAERAWDEWIRAKATEPPRETASSRAQRGRRNSNEVAGIVFGENAQNSNLKRPNPYVVDLSHLTDSDDENQPATKKIKSEADDFKTNTDFISFESEEEDEEFGPSDKPIQLTAAQQAVVDMALRGNNVFLTGAAGSGKTATLKEILRRLKARYPEKDGTEFPSVQVVAPTGIAALPLNGKTTYSFAGW